MSAAIYTPIGGGRLDKVEAFDVLAMHLNIEERPLSEVRLNIFRLVFRLGSWAMEHKSTNNHPLSEASEGWEELGALYEGLAGLESSAMADSHKLNLSRYMDERAASVQ